MFVMTVDQKSSQQSGDAVPGLLDTVGRWAATRERTPFVLPMERTVGDEVQAVLAEPADVVALALLLQRIGTWSVGIGAGAVVEPLADSAPASSGPAFVLARSAGERARGRTVSVPLAVDGVDAEADRPSCSRAAPLNGHGDGRSASRSPSTAWTLRLPRRPRRCSSCSPPWCAGAPRRDGRSSTSWPRSPPSARRPSGSG